MHCSNASCIKACPRAAIYQDMENGVVAGDQDRCIGCKFWVTASSPTFTQGHAFRTDVGFLAYRKGSGTKNLWDATAKGWPEGVGFRLVKCTDS